MKRSSSETISRGEKSVMCPKVGWNIGQASGLDNGRDVRIRRCHVRSCAADHQKRRAVRGIDDTILAETGLLVSAYRTCIGGIGGRSPRGAYHARAAAPQNCG